MENEPRKRLPMVGFTAEPDFKQRLEEAAKKDRRSVAQILRMAAERYLDQQQQSA